MFQTFQNLFGAKFWKNSVIDVSHNCDARNRKKVEAWLEKLSHKFPSASEALSSKVFIDAPEMENDTLEDCHFLQKRPTTNHVNIPRPLSNSLQNNWIYTIF